MSLREYLVVDSLRSRRFSIYMGRALLGNSRSEARGQRGSPRAPSLPISKGCSSCLTDPLHKEGKETRPDDKCFFSETADGLLTRRFVRFVNNGKFSNDFCKLLQT